MSLKVKALTAASVVAGFAAFAAPASAATFVFVQGGHSPSAGYTVVDTFADSSGLTGSGYLIKTPPADGDGAPPASSNPAGTSYLSVLANGTATYLFANPVTAFQFDWGSIDTYNTLSFVSSIGGTIVIPGANFSNPGNGNQTDGSTNGLFTVTGAPGETFSSVTFASSRNSFEVDNLAIAAIPEPATWAMMLIGFGLIGATTRYRRRHSNITYA